MNGSPKPVSFKDEIRLTKFYVTGEPLQSSIKVLVKRGHQDLREDGETTTQK